MSPDIVIKNIQFLLQNSKSNENSKQCKNTIQIISSLVAPKKNATRKILSKIHPIYNKLFQRRDTTKNLLCAYIHELRMGFHYLSELMIKEGLLPSKDLIFYLTHNEIKTLIYHSDVGLIHKATRRQALFKHWNELKYPKFVKNVLQPDRRYSEKIEHNFKDVLKGIPVSMGTRTGRACIVKSTDEIDQIQLGDILITESIDIGWCGYFSVLAGVATEMGGLISEGAVVARELGLPCIMGVENATHLIKTGDKIKLVADNGLLFKIE